MDPIDWGALVVLLLFVSLVFFLIRPWNRHSRVMRARERLIEQIEARRGSRVIVMIERPKIESFLGIPRSRSLDIDIEDPAEVARNIRLTLPNVPIDFIVHTTGGLPLLSGPIADALVRHNAPITLMVPYYAVSGGTRLALASDKLLMGRSAVLGPDACPPGSLPPLGILESLAEVLGDGCWTHTAPITFDVARELGMSVSDLLPDEAYRIVDLYPKVPPQLPLAPPVPLLPAPNDAEMPKPEEEKT